MPGNVADRMAQWPMVKELISGYPVRRVWEIFNKMLVDREKFIIGNDIYGWGAKGFLARSHLGFDVVTGFAEFIKQLVMIMNYRYAVYPLYPAESGLPVLDSFSKIVQYAARKYPELHNTDSMYYPNYTEITEYKPEECYKTSAAGGDDEYEFINQYQLFEKLWNLLHYFGGICLIYDRSEGVPYFETKGNSMYPGHSYSSTHMYHLYPDSSGCFGGLRFFYTPQDDLAYKYVAVGVTFNWQSGNIEESGIVQYRRGNNILYESDWTQGSFTSPWITENSSLWEHELFEIGAIRLHVYPRFPDLYDPDTLEPMYF